MTMLEAVDAALDEGRVTDPESQDVQELALALRAETPRPSDAFAERLERQVVTGFGRRSPRRRIGMPRRPFLPALAVAASLLVALVVVVSITRHGGNDDRAGALERAHPDSAAGGALKVAPPVSAQTAPGSSGQPSTRRVQRSASLTLAAPGSKLDTVAGEVVSTVDRHHGYVLHSTVTTGSRGGATGGSFYLQVPSRELQATLSDLSALAHVRSRTENADDITAPYNATAARLAETRAIRHSLLGRLAQATTDTEANALRRRIRLVSAQIRSLSARFARLQRRARYASVDVTLERERPHHSASASGIGRDFHDALDSLVTSLGIALRVLGVAIPLAIAAALAWLAAAALRRRMREAALS